MGSDSHGQSNMQTAGQSNTKCCSSSTQSNDLHTRHSLSVLSR